MDKTKRWEMIYTLYKNELSFLVDHPDELNAVAEFFTQGGFNDWDDTTIQREYEELTA